MGLSAYACLSGRSKCAYFIAQSVGRGICQRVKQIHDRAISLAQYFGRKAGRVELFRRAAAKV